MEFKNQYHLKIDRNISLFIFWGMFCAFLFTWFPLNFKNILLILVIFSIPLILANPKVGLFLFIFSLPIHAREVTPLAHNPLAFHIRLYYIFFVATLFSWILHKVIKREKVCIVPTQIDLPLVCFLLISIISIFQSFYIAPTGEVLYMAFRNYPVIKSITRVFLLIFMMIIFYFGLSYINSKQLLKFAIISLLISTVFFSMLGFYGVAAKLADKPLLLQVDLTSFYSTEFPRMRSLALEPMFFGSYVISFLPLFILLYLSKNYIISKWFHLFSLGINSVALFFTFSRSVWLAGLVLVGLISGLYHKPILQNKQFRKFSIPIIFILILIASIFFKSQIEDIKDLLAYHIGGAIDPANQKFLSTKLRLIAVNTALHAFVKHPILGIGMENFHFYSGLWDLPELGYPKGFKYYPITINNLPLHFLTELGIIGFGITIWLVITIIKALYLPLKNLKKDSYLYNLTLGGLLAFIIFLVHSLFFSTFTFPHLWFALAIPFIAINLAKHNEDSN